MARVNMHYASFRSKMTGLRRELRSLSKQLTSDFFEELQSIYLPQMRQDIDAEVPEKSGDLANSIKVTARKLKNGFSIWVSARVYDTRSGYNYAYIQHENLDYEHSKPTAKASYIEDPFMQMIEDISEIELGIFGGGEGDDEEGNAAWQALGD